MRNRLSHYLANWTFLCTADCPLVCVCWGRRPLQMTWTSTMSSGYSSLEEDSEEFFFTARTSFFKKPQAKPKHDPDVEKEREPQRILTKEEIKQRIEAYNSTVTDRLKMTLNSNEVYTGFIKVQLDLRRPITIRPIANQGSHAFNNNNETAFYMPKDTTNTLHISSTNTVKEVIEALLKKFMVADNPAKFALFKQSRKEEQVHTSKLLDAEHPLYLRLFAGPSYDALSFVLREHETGEVLWDAFSLPELQNFLRILAKEEDDHFRLLKRRYVNYRAKLEEALRGTGKPG
ncbi:ras association domain-containing protein 3 isoform X2 [Heptranchias perlo]|uniref:ras association domain-containing protein 3 isoform X2 n=1 Tax=Heptranchias perlo TaxID=212740 RepID=UPI00355A98CB